MMFPKESLPSWERGLKFLKGSGENGDDRSLPSWERGLKCKDNLKRPRADIVAPLVGAWVEIAIMMPFLPCCPVAPLVGAWVEITILIKKV